MHEVGHFVPLEQVEHRGLDTALPQVTCVALEGLLQVQEHGAANDIAGAVYVAVKVVGHLAVLPALIQVPEDCPRARQISRR